MKPSSDVINLQKWLTKLKGSLTFTSIFKDMIKNTDEQIEIMAENFSKLAQGQDINLHI